jgi:monofunctional biosynthetic peptidoglycan transglycosylase
MPARRPPRSLPARLFGFVAKLAVAFVVLSLVWVVAYRFVPVPLTWPMARDAIQGHHVESHWVALTDITPAVPRAAIGAEDARFCEHRGFDIQAIEAAAERNADGGKLRGGSTISQQTAKNAFLWPGRSYIRKGLEAWFTVLIEAVWGKPRIMEVYLNIAEMGPGIYGVDAAAQHYFHVPAARLTPQQAARIVAILPQPIKRSAVAPKRFTKRYANRIERRIGVVARGDIDRCLR